MGSKLRKLRQKAGVTGYAYRKEEGRRAKERERRVRAESAALAVAEKQVVAAERAALPPLELVAGPSVTDLLSEMRLDMGAADAAAARVAMLSGQRVLLDEGQWLRVEEARLLLARVAGREESERIHQALSAYAATTTEDNSSSVLRGLEEARVLLTAGESLATARHPALRTLAPAPPAAEQWHTYRPGAPRTKLGMVLALAMLASLGTGVKGDDRGF